MFLVRLMERFIGCAARDEARCLAFLRVQKHHDALFWKGVVLLLTEAFRLPFILQALFN
jgi:hypothetical protein